MTGLFFSPPAVTDQEPMTMGMNQYDHLHLAMFSGKGGVGKTTLSCGFARYWAHRFPDQQILLLSTDPAHSLGDVLQMPVGDSPQPMPDLPNLQVRALDAHHLLQTFKAEYGEVLELLVERGSFVQGEDLTPVWDLSWPGVDELMGILEIQRILRQQEVDRVVVDMAPSGHTLNLFGLMDFLDNLLDAMNLFQEKHRVISQSFTGRYSQDNADEFLVTMKADLAAGRSLLQDADRTACLVVAIAEPMSWLETRRFLGALEGLSIPVGGILVNHILAPSPGDGLGNLYIEQAELLEKYRHLVNDPSVLIVPQQRAEPVGAIALDHLMAEVNPASALEPIPPTRPSIVVAPTKLLPSFDDFLDAGRQLIIVGGKGGVGKTTVAAAIAWAMSDRHPDRQVRVMSIDPAHSLGDAYGTTLTHTPRALAANLSAQEIDARQVLDQFRDDYLWELAEMMSGDTGDDSLQLAYGPQAWRQIVEQALPGIDEMLSLITVMDLLDQQQQDLIVLDTAPTGHLLRFLEMPTAMGDWLAWIFKLWIKYQDMVGRTEFMGRLRTLRQRVVQAQKNLKNPAFTEFIGVLQSQSAVVAEAERLTRSLADLGVHQRYLVHNRCLPDQPLPPDSFSDQTIIHLPPLPRGIAPITQIQMAADLLF